MITSKIEELQALREKTALLEQQIEKARSAELAALPAQYGFESAAAFLAAVRAATGGKRVRKGQKASGTGAERRKRAKVTDEIRDQVKKLVAEGVVGAQIAKKLGISLPTVQNIKKALGLVQKRKG